MIRFREAAGALLDEPMRQVWKNMEWQMMLLMTTEGVEALTTEEVDWLGDLRVWLSGEVLHRLRTGEWRCEGYRRGDPDPVVLRASWWVRQSYLDLWGETTRWNDVELTGLTIEGPPEEEEVAPPPAPEEEEEVVPFVHTGPGRPTPWAAIEPELGRRYGAGELLASDGDEAEHLSGWWINQRKKKYRQWPSIEVSTLRRLVGEFRAERKAEKDAERKAKTK